MKTLDKAGDNFEVIDLMTYKPVFKNEIITLLKNLEEKNYFKNSNVLIEENKDIQDLKLLEEMSELSKEILKRMLSQGRDFESLSWEHKNYIMSEVTDVLITLIGFIGRHNIDTELIDFSMCAKLSRFDDVIHSMKQIKIQKSKER